MGCRRHPGRPNDDRPRARRRDWAAAAPDRTGRLRQGPPATETAPASGSVECQIASRRVYADRRSSVAGMSTGPTCRRHETDMSPTRKRRPEEGEKAANKGFSRLARSLIKSVFEG